MLSPYRRPVNTISLAMLRPTVRAAGATGRLMPFMLIHGRSCVPSRRASLVGSVGRYGPGSEAFPTTARATGVLP